MKQNYNLGQFYLDVRIEDLTTFDEQLANELVHNPHDYLQKVHPSSRSPVVVYTTYSGLGGVRGLDFNPNQASLLASGSGNGEVFVWDLNVLQPYAPGAQKSPSGDAGITSIKWNKKD